MFLVLVARAPATVWKVSRSGVGVVHHLEKTRQFVNHYSFHIMDPMWGHVTIKISGHPPFGAQVILNGHEYIACAGQKAGLGFAKEGNCFTRVSEPERLAQIADTLSQPGTIGRLSQGTEGINARRSPCSRSGRLAAAHDHASCSAVRSRSSAKTRP